jgi:hypothetical protein
MSEWGGVPRRAGWSYSGEAWTDADGRAIVQLPPFVRSHGAGFEYELTPVGSAAAWLEAEIEGDHFVIATDPPHTKVAWKVTALTKLEKEEP